MWFSHTQLYKCCFSKLGISHCWGEAWGQNMLATQHPYKISFYFWGIVWSFLLVHLCWSRVRVISRNAAAFQYCSFPMGFHFLFFQFFLWSWKCRGWSFLVTCSLFLCWFQETGKQCLIITRSHQKEKFFVIFLHEGKFKLQAICCCIA